MYANVWWWFQLSTCCLPTETRVLPSNDNILLFCVMLSWWSFSCKNSHSSTFCALVVIFCILTNVASSQHKHCHVVSLFWTKLDALLSRISIMNWIRFYIHRLVSKDLHAFIAGNVPRPIFPHYISNSDLSDLSVNRWRMVGEVRMSVWALTLCSVWAEKRCMATRTYTNLTFKNVKSAGNINRSESFFKRVARRLCFPGSDYTPIPDSSAATHWFFAGLNANKISEDERNIYSGLTCT